MLSFRNASLRKKLLLMSMLVSGLSLLLACGVFLIYDAVAFRETVESGLRTRGRVIGYNCVSALLFRDPHSAEETLAGLKGDPHIISAGVYTLDGQPFAAYWRDASPQGQSLPPIAPNQADESSVQSNVLVLYSRIAFEDKPVGIVYFRMDLDETRVRQKRYAGIVLVVLAGCLLASLPISSILQRQIADPILHLVDTAQVVSREKNYSVRAATIPNRDEVALLIETFNEMLAQIQGQDAALNRARDELEGRVEERTAELAAINKELEAFTYSVSHDLRAPLRHIDGFSKLLLEEYGDRLPDEGKRYLTLIRGGTKQMGQLVDDLLNLARIGRKELSLQVTGLSSLVQEVVEELKRDIPNRAIEWKVHSLPFVECDPALMKQVFINLLSNAVKYTRPREQAVVEIGTMAQDGQFVVFIRDNGVGFNMKYAEKLFGVFQRLHRPEDFEGTGVGLATVQRVIQKHGGRVWAEAELDRGATFFFTLPKARNNTDVGGDS